MLLENIWQILLLSDLFLNTVIFLPENGMYCFQGPLPQIILPQYFFIVYAKRDIKKGTCLQLDLKLVNRFQLNVLH